MVIGDGEKGCSASKVFELGGDHYVSHNSVSYWISRCYLGMGMTIFKNTEEGRKLAQMIAEKRDGKEVEAWLQGVLLSHVSQGRLKKAVTRAVADAFEQGRQHKAEELRSVLGL